MLVEPRLASMRVAKKLLLQPMQVLCVHSLKILLDQRMNEEAVNLRLHRYLS